MPVSVFRLERAPFYTGLSYDGGLNVLPTGVEPAGLWHLVSDFSFRAQLERQSRDADDDAGKDGRVHFPVRGLCVPATGRRPDVLGVPG